MARRVLQPLDITLRHGRGYQLARRAFLGFSLALTLGLPLMHLRAASFEGAGLADDSAWARAMKWLPVSSVAVLGAPTSIELFGVELVDPLEWLGVTLQRGVTTRLVWTLLPGLLLVVLLGRFFCGWACPYLPILAASNATRWFLSRLGVPLRDLKVPRVSARVAMVGVLVGSSLLGTQLLPLVYPPAVIGREVFRALFYGSLGAGSFVVLGAFVFDTFISRAGFCRSLCPGGAMFSTLGALSAVRVHREVPKCTDCTVCDVVCNLGQLPMTDKLDGGCERCGKCIAACPTRALSWKLAVPSALRSETEKPRT